MHSAHLKNHLPKSPRFNQKCVKNVSGKTVNTPGPRRQQRRNADTRLRAGRHDHSFLDKFMILP
jgi:hypothetical protein